MTRYTKQPRNVDVVSVDEFYEMIDESLNDSPEDRQWPYYAMDYVAGRREWENFKAAMARWMEKMDRESVEGFAQADAEAGEAEFEVE